MSNPFRNEQVIKLGQKEILLRPSFENIAALEAHVGNVSYLAWLFGGGPAKQEAQKTGKPIDQNKLLPPLTTVAMVFYYCQASRKADNPEIREFTLDEIWDMVQEEGVGVIKNALSFLAKITAGNAHVREVSEMSDAEKKS